jgi:hypothetical protein
MVKRNWAGTNPYAPITWGQNTLSPTYLPFQWLPYTAAELLHKDYRWIPALAMTGAATYFFFNNLRKIDAGIQNVWQLLIPLYPLIVWVVLLKNEPYSFTITVESLIAAYYLIAAESIKSRNIVFTAFAIGICMLSRYSIIFWIPLCILCFYSVGKWRKTLIIMATLLTVFLVVYWLPYLRIDSGSFIRGYEYHTRAAQYDWHFGNYLTNGLGFTAWATWLLQGAPHTQLLTYQIIHMTLCSIIIVACMVYFIRSRNKLPLKPFLLSSLKLYLTVFYLFIQTPYNYLFIVPVIISAAMLTPIKATEANRINTDSRS